jgi:cytochrome P450
VSDLWPAKLVAADHQAGDAFVFDDPAKLDDPFADFARYRKQRPVYYHAPLSQWFVFRYDDVAALFRDPRLSADRMKGFVDQAPAEVRGELRQMANSSPGC